MPNGYLHSGGGEQQKEKDRTQWWAQAFDLMKNTLALIGVAFLVVVIFGIFYGGGILLEKLKQPEIARGFITFLVTSANVVIAVMLTLFAISGTSNK
jgi:ABC-type dipeptide/oligopeptide/nickel transport system permease component